MINPALQFGVGLGFGFAPSSAGVVGVVGLLFAFVFVFGVVGVRLPLRPRRAGLAVVGGMGPASAPGLAVGSAGAVAGAATGSAVTAGCAEAAGRDARRVLAAREPAGVNEQTCVVPGTLVNVSRSRDFLARIETITGAALGCAAVAGASSPNCIATAV